MDTYEVTQESRKQVEENAPNVVWPNYKKWTHISVDTFLLTLKTRHFISKSVAVGRGAENKCGK